MDQRFNPPISPSRMGNGVIDLDDDDDFLALAAAAAAAAEAAAVESRTKRQKLSTLAAVGGGGSSSENVPEGPYMAALRGSRSNLWKQQQEQPKKGAFAPLGQANNSSVNTGSCFKCGMPGHWSRDCANVDGTGGGGGGGGGGAEGDVAEKPCPCGLGSCLVLTSNTAKNPGRKFYRCPQRPENGGCSFFEWCDSPSAPLPGYSAPRGAPTYEPYSRGAPTYESYPRGAPAYESNSSVSDLQCPCGGGPCLVLTSKTTKNPGRQYYSCPKKEFSLQGKNSCNFFKWCDECTPVANEPSLTPQNNPGSQYSGGTGKECFKCGKEGHWARDCIVPDSNAPSFTSQYNPNIQHSGGTGAPCYKCGKEGHWARNCTMPSLDYSADARQNKPAASGSGTCFKCGETGHWARDCPGQGSGASGGSRRASDSFANPYSYKSR